ncbi:4Fe-4S binding protein [Thermogladius sp. 4427co]|uniref:4Fe-4S binding protein n=1 Tax=Thermogladius sp. 4427co TaxID=3450718 RepID=UPI003F798012
MGKPRLLQAVIRNLVSKPATIQYPYAKTEVEKGFRGRHYADLTKCTGCSLCALDCPADAISMVQIPEGYSVPRTNPRRLYPRIDYGRCVFCYRCVTVCPFNAYITTNEYTLAGGRLNNSERHSLSTLEKVSL